MRSQSCEMSPWLSQTPSDISLDMWISPLLSHWKRIQRLSLRKPSQIHRVTLDLLEPSTKPLNALLRIWLGFTPTP